MNKVYLGLGSNIGDRYQYLHRAIELINNHSQIELKSKSSVYETKPFGYVEQPDFLNMVIAVNTTLKPEELLKYTQEIENLLGRKREIHWGPRIIDIDILLYGDKIIQTVELSIPHPFLTERLFVLIPLAEIFNGNVPGQVLSIEQLIKKNEGGEGIIKLWKE